MSAESIKPKDAVSAMLIAAGFALTGQIANPGVVAYFAGQAVGGKFSYRNKYRRGDTGCTVGARTTCIYHIGANGPDRFKNIKTKDIGAIQAEITSRGDSNG